jgi:hypothetical protein
MLPLNLNLQLNATSALWANDSAMENITQTYSKIWWIKYKKERKEKGRNWSFFLQEKGSVPMTCCWRRRWAPRTFTCDDLSRTTLPLQHRGLELDRQETSATEVCESSFSFFLREKLAGKGGQGKTQIGEESLSGQCEPQQYWVWSKDQTSATAVHVS